MLQDAAPGARLARATHAAYTFAVLAASTALGRGLGRGGRLARARRAWRFARALARLRLRNAFERAILCTLLLEDEYRLDGARLHRDDVIVDVGAHVGGFSWLCHRLGSRQIHAFECDEETFALLRANLAGLAGIHLERRAVFRSDSADDGLRLELSRDPGGNTGATTALFASAAAAPPTARAVRLDDVLRRLGGVRLLKLDCEGCEFPVLLTSRELDRVDEIAGEYHELGPEDMARLAPAARVAGLPLHRKEDLRAHLEGVGFRVDMAPTGARLGLFWAWRGEPLARARR